MLGDIRRKEWSYLTLDVSLAFSLDICQHMNQMKIDNGHVTLLPSVKITLAIKSTIIKVNIYFLTGKSLISDIS